MRCRAVVIISKPKQSPAFPSAMLFSFCCGKIKKGFILAVKLQSIRVGARAGTQGRNLEVESMERAGLLQVHIEWPRPTFWEMLS